MKFNASLLLSVVLVASGSSAYASTGGDDLGIAGRTLVARTTGSPTGTTLTGTGTETATGADPTNTGSAECNWCECLTAAAAEGLACAAAILEGGCNPIADISCIIDMAAFSQAIPKCIACFR
ncbi:hypothetical protein R3P38DRAFT_3189003 [Favolaschia claudopus]|uniref:Fungal calcium binding protein domain-containing protein n=1 Tax=Favolaschia claudopus TaxID=2862362 RepID=A0AAW0BBL3_9AGAR